MILMYPHNADWDGIAELTGDESWRADRMRSHFERMEDCHHRDVERLAAELGYNPSRHGFGGWLSTEKSIPSFCQVTLDLVETIVESATAAIAEIGDVPDRLRWLNEGYA